MAKRWMHERVVPCSNAAPEKNPRLKLTGGRPIQHTDASMVKRAVFLGLVSAAALAAASPQLRRSQVGSCVAYAIFGLREVAQDQASRFLGKVSEDTARCRGGEASVNWRRTPWVDWLHYWSAAGAQSRYSDWASALGFFGPNRRGINGALLDLEYQRIELLKFNLFDNSGTYEHYLRNRRGAAHLLQKSWPQFRLPPEHPLFHVVGGTGPQRCAGAIIRFRTLSGICNDTLNPLMGSVDQPFSRNVEFEATFPEAAQDSLAANRHGNRIGLLKPDPQFISRKLFTRRTSGDCAAERSQAETPCAYLKADHVNVLAAFWIQFMTHDWFSHLAEGRNAEELMPTGCSAAPAEIAALGCRPDDRIDKSLMAENGPAQGFVVEGRRHLARAPKTTLNKVTAWWDASQIYGYDATSQRRVKRDPRDRAKLLLETELPGAVDGYLPLLQSNDPQNRQWAGQEAVAFPDNWSVGLSFFHNVFAREHNLFVDEFRQHAMAQPETDSGLRDPDRPDAVIANKDVSAEELFEIARLVVAAEIAKIHTIEWTTQMLYNEPLYLAMNANWSGLLEHYPLAGAALGRVLGRLKESDSDKLATEWYSAFAAGPGIVGLGNGLDDVNGGVHHFGSPFSFPEEFVNAYRLHAMVPDVLELRDLRDANAIAAKIGATDTLRSAANGVLRRYGISSWALSLGRQRAGALTLNNHPRFLQALAMPRLQSATGKVDVAAIDIIRDREHGIPRYNEFRRQYGLRQLKSFDDFIDPRLPPGSAQRKEQERTAVQLREIYGQHHCDAAKIITRSQTNDDGSAIDDCLGHAHGSLVDNIEDLDTMVGWLAENVRPHGFAISETQLQVFILNASRRLFSDRFFTSSFRPAFYSNFGIRWVNDNGPDGKVMERGEPNGHRMEVSPLKRVLSRTIPELKPELEQVINVFDPWGRDRESYYSLKWKPRPGAETDPAFKKNQP